MAEGAWEGVENFCRLVSSLVKVFNPWNDSTAFALIVFLAFKTKYYIKQYFDIQFEYDHKILKTWQTLAEQYHHQET